MKKIMKALWNLFRWLLALLMVLCGISFGINELPAMIAFILCGISILPLTWKILNPRRKKGKKFLAVILPVFLVIVVGIVTPPVEVETSDLQTVQQNSRELESSTETVAEELVKTPELTATPEPTATSEPTATPEPTVTPEPTATPEPTPISEPDYNLTMHVLDVGQGLSLLFESNGNYMLYDGGDRDYSSKVVAYLKQQGVQEIEYLIASHYDSDHLNGLVGALNVFEVHNVIGPDYTTDTRVFESFVNIIQEKGLEIREPVVGDKFTFGTTEATILAPTGSGYGDENDYSVAVRLDCKDTSILVTGDATTLSESEMISSDQNLDVDILIIGHHGSDGSNSEAFLSSTSPELAVISCGEDNQYLHPNQVVVERLQTLDIDVFRTDKQGDIVLSSDGVNINYSAEPCNDYSYGIEKEIVLADMYATTEVNVRSAPGTDSEILGRLSAGDVIAVEEINGDWTKVVFNGGTAYVATLYLSETQLENEPVVTEPQSSGITYVLNTKSHKFHYPSCHSVKQMADHNRGESNESREELIARGYSPCGNCDP